MKGKQQLPWLYFSFTLILCSTVLLLIPAWVSADEQSGSQAYYAQHIPITDDTLVRDSATGLMVPFRELKQQDINQKLDSVLDQLIKTFKVVGIEQAKAFAGKSGIIMRDNLVEVTIELNKKPESGRLEEKCVTVNRQIAAAGGDVKGYFQEYLRAYLPIEVLEKVARLPEIRIIRVPSGPSL
jgi:hypothetical protein